MRIGFDFDNTIVCYDQAIKVLSNKLKLPNELNPDKLSISNYLKKQNRENEWTEFQGTLYGPGMMHAKPYRFFIKIAKLLSQHQHELFIVSHRTKYPYAGEKHELHQYARDWLELQINTKELFINKNIYFLETLEEKIKKIEELKIDLFVDDLIEVINHALFPLMTKSILFDPENKSAEFKNRITNWEQLISHV